MMDRRPFIDDCLTALHPSPLPDPPSLHTYARSKLLAAQHLTGAYCEHFAVGGGRTGVAFRAAGLRLNDEWAIAETLLACAFEGHLAQVARFGYALSLDEPGRFEGEVLERDRQLARQLEEISEGLRDSVDAIFDALETEIIVGELGCLIHKIIVFHLSLAAEVYHQVATLHLVAGSEKARERTERTVRQVCESAESKLSEFRRTLRHLGDWDRGGGRSDTEVEGDAILTEEDEETREDGTRSVLGLIEGEGEGEGTDMSDGR